MFIWAAIFDIILRLLITPITGYSDLCLDSINICRWVNNFAGSVSTCHKRI